MTSSFSQPIPLNVDYGKSLQIRHRSLELREDDLKLIIKQIVDFKSFVANVYPLSKHFGKQGWINSFDILNGPTYPYLVKVFWFRAKIYDEYVAQAEARIANENDWSLKGNTRVEMGLKDFKGTEIWFVVMGIEVSITHDNITKLIGVDNQGIVKLNYKDETLYAPDIKANIFENQNNYGKVKNLNLKFKLLFKIIISFLIPKEGISDQISWDHKHFLWFLVTNKPLNLAAYIFHHLCEFIKDSRNKKKKSVPHAKL